MCAHVHMSEGEGGGAMDSEKERVRERGDKNWKTGEDKESWVGFWVHPLGFEKDSFRTSLR